MKDPTKKLMQNDNSFIIDSENKSRVSYNDHDSDNESAAESDTYEPF